MAQLELFCFLCALLFPALLVLFNGFHIIEEGHVGVYYRGGALLESTTEPGFHFKLPLITSFENIQVTVQTDKVINIPCGTAGGVVITFDHIEVVNRLRKDSVYDTIKNYTIHYDKTWIFDKIHHEINQFCSKHTLQEVFIDKFDALDEQLANSLQNDCNKWAPGIEIIAIRVTKPRIPDTLLKNYEKIEAQKTQLLIAEQEQKVSSKKAETVRLERKIEAESQAEVNKIDMEKNILQKESLKTIEAIENSIYLEKERSKADAHYYKISRMIEAEQKQLSTEYLKKLAIESFSNNTKIYFGPSIPQLLVENVDEFLKHKN
ncbi:spfh band 7 phb domain-containing membrane-associated protein [Stylonychia lemnae]|uniref:Spfh band 7 phb domain-containing membrane-associated protein n=1 Tax=Stylonychia lemnae TaxID=5949 RepID=A0A078BBC3_STYLE|nr:spfh band 7 phb domain-containing membrane-associated protein [Stylonychia lemnae]|eukprot:CDW91496.1 spfh band 7 phb domain-containing membrane-associated protein [Stylonychia lemnae]